MEYSPTQDVNNFKKTEKIMSLLEKCIANIIGALHNMILHVVLH